VRAIFGKVLRKKVKDAPPEKGKGKEPPPPPEEETPPPLPPIVIPPPARKLVEVDDYPLYGRLRRFDGSRYFSEHPTVLLQFLQEHIGIDVGRLRVLKAVRETREKDAAIRAELEAAAEPEPPVKGKPPAKGKK